MPATRAQSRHQNATNNFHFNSPLEMGPEVGLGGRQCPTGLVAGSLSAKECASALLALPTEIRLQIYECILLPAVCGDGEAQPSAERDDLFDRDQLYIGAGNRPSNVNHQSSDHLTYDALGQEQRNRNLATSERPTSEGRKTYGQLLLVCKTIHCEAAPLFFSKATFFIREPFQFANTFLRKLALDKIYSLRFLELRMTVFDFNTLRPWRQRPKIKVLYNLQKLFEMYHRDLSGLESVVLTLVVTGTITPQNRKSDIGFRPLETRSLPWWAYGPVDCMLEAGQALAKIMRGAQFALYSTAEEVYGKTPDGKCVTLGGTVARVRLQRMM